MKFATLVIALGSYSCVSHNPRVLPPRPTGGEYSTASGHGRVLFGGQREADEAREVIQLIDELFLRTGERLGSVRQGTVEIWLIDGWNGQASTFKDVIVLDSSSAIFRFARPLLTHEFVHWHMGDTLGKSHLPYIVREGLCEVIAADLLPRWGADRTTVYRNLLERARDRRELRSLLDRIDLNQAQWFSLPTSVKHDLYALGFVLVERIGIDSLLAAAEHGRLSKNWILETAGVGANGTGLREGS